MNTDTYGTPGATSPEKKKFVASLASKAYTGPSIVDYLSKSGYATDPASRTALAKEVGIDNYSVNPNNATQNTEFLNRLRNGYSTSSASETPAGTGTPSPTPTGGAESTPTPQTPDPYRVAFDEYINSLKETPEEKAAKDYLNNLITGSKLAEEKALNSGETLGFAAGEAQRVNRNNAITMDAAARSYDALSGSRINQSTAAKARAEFEKSIYDKNTPKNDPFELSPGQERYAFNPKTGAYEKVASVAKEVDPLDEEYKRAQIRNIDSQISDRVANPGGKPTEGDKKSNAYSKVNAILQPGVASSDGVPFLAPDGFLTYEGFKKLVSAAQSDGISRKEFMQEYGSYFQKGVNDDYAGYNLTEQEKKTLRGY